MGYLEPQIFFSSPSCSFIVPLFWVFVSEWGLFRWLLDNQHSSISKWFSFSYTSEVSSFFCTQGDWPVLMICILNWVVPVLVPQKSVANFHWTFVHSDAHKFVFGLLLCPIYWLEQRRHESCCRWLLTPPLLSVRSCLWSYFSELPEVPKLFKFQPSVCVLRSSKKETEDI